MHFNSKCITVPTGRQIRHNTEQNLAPVTPQDVRLHVNMVEGRRISADILTDHRAILARAQEEALDPSLSPESPRRIDTLVQTADESAQKGTDALI